VSNDRPDMDPVKHASDDVPGYPPPPPGYRILGGPFVLLVGTIQGRPVVVTAEEPGALVNGAWNLDILHGRERMVRDLLAHRGS
jgi:hypothetical protein